MQVFRNLFLLILISCIAGCASSSKNSVQPDESPKTLLWKISGNGIKEPSYVYGTIHMLCKEYAVLSDSLKGAISRSSQVYFEVDMDNLFEMMGALTQMKMKNDTTLADLLTKDEYETVKKYFQENSTLLPFSVIEKYKPFLAASTMMEGSLPCENSVAMEQVILQQATKAKKKINGLETMAYQMSIFDSIPYKTQAAILLKSIRDAGNTTGELKEYDELLNAYKEQNLDKLEQLTRQEDMGIANFEDLLLFNRNRNWAKMLNTLLKEKSMIIAVGAGHLPGEKGLLNLLRQEGFTVEPVENKIDFPKKA